MSDPLMSIGLFVFGLPDLAYEDLERRTDWRWGESERFGARAAGQFLGPGSETITLNGILVPEIAGRFSSLERLREMAASGEEWEVTLGNGTVLGSFRIMAIDDRWRNIIAGGLPRAVDFAVDLKRAD
jgi:phage protein U